MISLSAEFAGFLVGLVGSAIVVLALSLQDAKAKVDWLQSHSEALAYELYGLNKHAHLLGKVVEAKVYAGSKWERMVVVAVSWRGAVCVRPVRDMETKGRWIPKSLAPARVREVGIEIDDE